MTGRRNEDNAPSENAAWLSGKRAALAGERDRLKTGETRWSAARLITFVAAGSIWLFVENVTLGGGAVIVGLVVFGWTVHRHRGVRARRERADQLLVVADESMQRCGGRVVLIRSHRRPPDDGEDALLDRPILDDGPTWHLTDQERDDLDLYAGPVGIFGLVNRTSTAYGARRLRDLIERPCLSADHIRMRQQAVRWLDEHPQPRLDTMAAATTLRDRDDHLTRLVAALRQVQVAPTPGSWRVMRVWSVITLAIMVWALVQMGLGHAAWRTVFLPLVIVNGMAYAGARRKLNECLDPWKRVAPAAAGYLTSARRAATDLPTDGILGRLRERFAAVVAPAALPALCNRVAWADSGGMIHALFNILFFWDLHVVRAILNRAGPHREVLLAGLNALADLEALNSLACLAYEQPVRCYPTPAEGLKYAITGGRHPLLPPDRVVANDVELGDAGRMWLITGSNMSGKSTFLRMAGVNCLLAQAGTVAVAEAMTWTPVRLITDLQVRDSLAGDESYFLAEVRHLRRMILPEASPAPLLGLIDEPFRGTNSADQGAASAALVEHLLESEHLFLIATHEQKLTELADGASARNRHFQENLREDGLVFDYLLRDGPARTRNALRILEREGYPPSVVTRARRWLEAPAMTPDPTGERLPEDDDNRARRLD
ncbi:MAG: hypothetical protein GY778_08650 [bacterium]|nr:hypothetical protein [bacterium]